VEESGEAAHYEEVPVTARVFTEEILCEADGV